MSRFVVALAFAIVSLGTSGTANAVRAVAGTTGGMNGTITSANGVPLDHVTVTVTSQTTILSATTNDRGFYNFRSLPPDTYVVSVTTQRGDSQVVALVTIVEDQILTVSRSTHFFIIDGIREQSRLDLVARGVVAEVTRIRDREQRAYVSLDRGSASNDAFAGASLIPGIVITGSSGATYAR